MSIAKSLRTLRRRRCVRRPRRLQRQALGDAAPTADSRTGIFLDVARNYTSSFTVEWLVEPAQNNLLKYTYTFSGFDGRAVPDISHFIVASARAAARA
jgi:hypothetical protein